MILYLDLETFCDVPINHGTHRYAERAEVLLTAFAVDDGAVEVVEGWPPRLRALALAADEIVIHNSRFDRTVLTHVGEPIFAHKITDTMAWARSVGLPGGLGKLCEILGVPVDQAKDKAGRQLIQLFCKPLPANRKVRRATKETHPVEWARFVDYARLDVEAMRAVRAKLPTWNYGWADGAPRAGRVSWLLDQKINDRGFAIDVDFARAAIDAVLLEQKRLARRVQTMTAGEVDAATQRDKLLAHLLGEYDVDLPDMQKATLERRVGDENLPAAVRELLAIRLEASGTSTAKYQALVNATSSDGRLRGALEWCGAARTGRWSGRLFQPQNLPRPKHKAKEIAATIEAVKAGCADLLFDDVIARCSSAIRGAIVAPAGRKLVVADLSNIEGRVLAWLAGEAWKVAAFADFDRGEGADLYKLAYARSFSISPDDVDGDQRQIGKVQELGLGYQGGVGAFLTFAAVYGLDLLAMTAAAFPVLAREDIAEASSFLAWTKLQNRPTYGLPDQTFIVCDAIKRAWRKAHPAVERFWFDLDDAVKNSISTPGMTLTVGRLKVRRDGAWLRIGLPSGRALCYSAPRVERDGQISYMGIDQYTRRWARLRTYGGKLVENVTQAVARDVIDDAMPRAEAAGYEVVLTVHDELVTETPAGDAHTADGLSAIMSTNPGWADELPLAAAGFEAVRYGKG